MVIVNPRNRSSRHVVQGSVLVLLATLALVLPQGVLSAPLQAASLQSTVKCLTSNAGLQYLDTDVATWGVPARIVQPSLASTTYPHLTSASEPLVPFQANGFHYNRPPPLT